MPEPVVSALSQVPCVLAMLFIMLRFLTHLKERQTDTQAFIRAREEAWQAFIAEHDDQVIEQLAELTRAVERLTELLITHDALVRGAKSEARQPEKEPLRLVRTGSGQRG